MLKHILGNSSGVHKYIAHKVYLKSVPILPIPHKSDDIYVKAKGLNILGPGKTFHYVLNQLYMV